MDDKSKVDNALGFFEKTSQLVIGCDPSSQPDITAVAVIDTVQVPPQVVDAYVKAAQAGVLTTDLIRHARDNLMNSGVMAIDETRGFQYRRETLHVRPPRLDEAIKCTNEVIKRIHEDSNYRREFVIAYKSAQIRKDESFVYDKVTFNMKQANMLMSKSAHNRASTRYF